MKKILLCALVLVGSLACSRLSHAENVAFFIAVRRDGKPLFNVPITVRTFDPRTGRLRTPLRLRTDAQGVGNANIEVASYAERESAPADARPLPPDYLVVDVPDAPLVVTQLDAFRLLKPGSAPKELNIGKGEVLSGKVLRDGKGTADAKVSMVYANGIPINDAQRGVSTPQLQGQTGADGMFTLRALQLEGNRYAKENGYVLVSAMATLTTDQTMLRGGESGQVLHSGAPINILLAENWTVRGRVVDDVTGRPVAGVRVGAVAYSVWPIEPAISNAKGEWELRNIPPQVEAFHVTATHPDYGLAWSQVEENSGPNATAERKEKLLTGTTLRLRPMTSLLGRVVDEATNKVPALVDPQWPEVPHVSSVYEEGRDNFGRGFTRTPPGP